MTFPENIETLLTDVGLREMCWFARLQSGQHKTKRYKQLVPPRSFLQTKLPSDNASTDDYMGIERHLRKVARHSGALGIEVDFR